MADTKIDYRPRKRAYQDENGSIVNARGRSNFLDNHRGPVEGKGSFFTPRAENI